MVSGMAIAAGVPTKPAASALRLTFVSQVTIRLLRSLTRNQKTSQMDNQLMSKQLLQSFNMHDLTLPNRVVMAPMTRSRAGVHRIPNALMADYYVQRASAGLIITEATTISEQANGWNQSPGIYTDEMVDG